VRTSEKSTKEAFFRRADGSKRFKGRRGMIGGYFSAYVLEKTEVALETIESSKRGMKSEKRGEAPTIFAGAGQIAVKSEGVNVPRRYPNESQPLLPRVGRLGFLERCPVLKRYKG